MSTSERTNAPEFDTQPKRAEMSLGELFSEMTSELSSLFRKEVELAKTEGRDEVRRASVAVGWFGGTGVAALIVLTMLSFAGAWLLDDVMPRSLAFAVVAAFWAVAGYAMFVAARKKMQTIEPLPQTTQTIKEDLQWVKTQTS